MSGSELRQKLKEEEQRKLYKAALKAEFMNEDFKGQERVDVGCEQPSFANYTNISTILCKFCKIESQDYSAFQIHSRSLQHVNNIQIARDSYNKIEKEAKKKSDLKKLTEDNDDNLLGKKKARGVIYFDEKVEIINPGEHFQMHNLPADFFDDANKRGEFAKNEAKNTKLKDLEAYRNLNKDQLKNFMNEARQFDNEIETNMWEEFIPKTTVLQKAGDETSKSKVLDDIKKRQNGQENIDRVKSRLELMKAKLNEKKQKLFS